jgi:transposase
LEEGYRHGLTHCFRQRCKMILLKSDGHTSNAIAIAVILSTNAASVNNWLKRYKATGIEGLKTKGGQGRKPILKEKHLSIVRAAVEQERQRLSQARQIVEENIGRKMSNDTLTRFLKVITAVTNG